MENIKTLGKFVLVGVGLVIIGVAIVPAMLIKGRE